MGNQKLKRTVVYVGIVCVMFFCSLCNIHAYTFEYGTIAVEHKELPVKKNGYPIKFNHPYKLAENIARNVLSNIYYREKGLFKRKSTLRVFQDGEVRQLVPLIVHAFSVATPAQVVTVSSYWERVVFTDRHNYCVLFITGHSLNIAFSRLHKLQTYSV